MLRATGSTTTHALAITRILALMRTLLSRIRSTTLRTTSPASSAHVTTTTRYTGLHTSSRRRCTWQLTWLSISCPLNLELVPTASS